MTATLPLPTRYLYALGAVMVAALAFFVARPLLLSGDADTGSASPAPAAVAPSTPAPVAPTAPSTSPPPVTPAVPAVPKVTLLPNLPKAIANALLQKKVVVVTLYAGTAPTDRAAVGEARRGAKAAGAGFVQLNVLKEDLARSIQPFAGSVATPSTLVVARPGNVVTFLDGTADSALVEQAAHNARAR